MSSANKVSALGGPLVFAGLSLRKSHIWEQTNTCVQLLAILIGQPCLQIREMITSCLYFSITKVCYFPHARCYFCCCFLFLYFVRTISVSDL